MRTLTALFVSIFCGFICIGNAIRLHGNGYEDVNVYIGDNVPEDSLTLQAIENWLSEASTKLYKASRYHVYLRNITIRIPKSWSTKPSYQQVSGSAGGSSNIIIDEVNPIMGNKPYTFGQTMCGKEALYTHYTPDVIKQGNSGPFGNLGIVFTHEWGHLRWGLFDEYASVKDHYGNIIEFYLQDGKWEPVRCTHKVKGTNHKWNNQECRLDGTGKPEFGCQFYPYRDNRATARGSIMGHSFIPSVEEFCDKTDAQQHPAHNNIAPNLQNIRCAGKSAWEVMREHPDFRGLPPGNPNADVKPTINYIQPNNVDRICLVIDKSGSMGGTGTNNLIQLARNAAVSLINFIIPDGAYFSIVTFDNNAYTNKNLIQISSKADRASLIKALPTQASGGTSIGSGVNRAMEVLKNGNADASIRGDIIYLTSDGEDGTDILNNIMPDVIKSGVIIHTLAMGRYADMILSNVSKATGGSSFFYSRDNENSTALIDALSEPFVQSSANTVVKIQSKQITSSNNKPYKDSFLIDDSIGNDTVIQYSGTSLVGVRLTVTTPHGTNFTEVGINSTQGVVAVKIPGTAQVGEYTISLSSGNGNQLSGTLGVQSKPSDPKAEVIKIKSWTPDANVTFSPTMQCPVYVSVLKGHMPVSNADVIVTIENEAGKSSILNLKDNGIGADTIKEDGIYSAFLLSTYITSGGRHSLKVLVEGVNATITVPVSRAAGPNDVKDSDNDKSLPSFQRAGIGQEFVVQNYTAPTTPDKDNIPPSAITTFTLSEIDDKGKRYTVTWKAVGDDFDIGKAKSYDLRLSRDLNSLITNPGNQITIPNSLDPKDPGEIESFIVDLNEYKEENATYFLAVRAKDDNNLIGDVSNIVSVSILTDKSWTVPIASEPVVKITQNTLTLGIIVAVVVVFVIALVVITGIFANSVFRWRNAKEKQIGEA